MWPERTKCMLYRVSLSNTQLTVCGCDLKNDIVSCSTVFKFDVSSEIPTVTENRGNDRNILLDLSSPLKSTNSTSINYKPNTNYKKSNSPSGYSRERGVKFSSTPRDAGYHKEVGVCAIFDNLNPQISSKIKMCSGRFFLEFSYDWHLQLNPLPWQLSN